MPDTPPRARSSGRLLIAVAVLVAIALLLTPPGRRVVTAFIRALRIRTPAAVSVNVGVAAGADRPIQRIFVALLADSATSLVDDRDQPVAGVAGAAPLVGFVPRRIEARHDTATVAVIGGGQLALAVERPLLLTMLSEAGERGASVPRSADGAPVTVRTPSGVRLQYGNCPAAANDTARTRLNDGATISRADCVVLTETPVADVTLPPGIDPDQLMRLSLEVFGLTPDQTAMLQRRFPWRAILTLSLPRFTRSYDSTMVQGRPAALFTTGGRRGSSYNLVWARDSLVFSLVGYGAPSTAVPLAESVR